jgi:threonyl-tRNA synthetase
MAGVISVRLPDGSTREFAEGTTAAEFAESIGPRLAKAAVVATVDGHGVDLSSSLVNGTEVAIVTADSDAGREVLRHSTAHVLAQAVLRLWPGAKYAIGPVIENGFYYDFELPDDARFSDEDLGRIEDEMRAIMREDQPFVRHEHDLAEGLELFADQPFKREIIEAVGAGAEEVDAGGGLAAADASGGPAAAEAGVGAGAAAPGSAGAGSAGAGSAGAGSAGAGSAGAGSAVAGAAAAGSAVVSTYWNTDSFTDLCRGPHVPSTGRLGHFKLMRVAGAYWRGDEKRAQLQRIYGTAWESEKALAAHLHQLEEAERRDHRKLGAELDLFSFPEEIGSGLAIFHPKGGTIRRLMEDYSRQRHVEAGYEFVNSPHITKSELFEISGHLDWFADGMYPPMELDGGTQYYLKPMNCPFHILVYRSRQRSYRELPLRFFEFGSVYRYEKSGVVHGLTRVRGMTQDDAHIFCSREEMGTELIGTMRFVLNLLRDFGLNEFYLELSTKPPGKAVGTDEDWEVATETLRSIATEMDLDLVMDEGGGAFYGPKISVQARDAIGRTWQLSTIQLDFQLPERFELEYVGADNGRHRPIMIHRALFGSVERFMAVLIEHYAGALPTWLSPEQVRVLPVTEANADYAGSVAAACAGAGLRVSVDDAAENLKARIRKAKLTKVPYILVVGADDVAAQTVGVNPRSSTGKPRRGVDLTTFVDDTVAEVARRGSPENAAAENAAAENAAAENAAAENADS